MTTKKKPTRTAVDLGGLDDLGDLNFNDLAGKSSAGAVPLADDAPKKLRVGDTFIAKNVDVLEDPDNYRKQFDIAETIAITKQRIADGKKPFRVHLSVRKHPTIENKWLLNNGARRKRTGIALNIEDLPVVWEEDYDADDRFLVNVGEAGHTPLEWAYYIEDRLKNGVSVKELAAIIAKSESFISKHRALLKMPDELLDIHEEKKCIDAEALYLMSNNWEKHKSDFLTLASSLGDNELIQQATVKAIIKPVKKEVTEAAPVATAPQIAPTVTTQVQVTPIVDPAASEGGFGEGGNLGESGDSDNSEKGDDEQEDDTDSSPPAVIQVPPVEPVKSEQVKTKDQLSGDDEKYKKPAVQIKYDDRPAKLNLSKKTTYGLVWIKYDDDGGEEMIAVNDIELVAIIDLVGAA
jgi:ParB family transcriptional regulator, chromosome partitioning protein